MIQHPTQYQSLTADKYMRTDMIGVFLVENPDSYSINFSNDMPAAPGWWNETINIGANPVSIYLDAVLACTLAQGERVTGHISPSGITLNKVALAVTSDAFATVAVSGQTSVSASDPEDTLTLVAGTNITLTTNSGAKSVTIASTGGGSPSPLNWVGDWQYEVTYAAGDICTYNSVLYTFEYSNPGEVPSPTSNSGAWRNMAHCRDFVRPWDSGVYYYTNDIIVYGGVLYRSLANVSNKNPVSEAPYWSKISSRAPAWPGVIVGCAGNGDPNLILNQACSGTVIPMTPTLLTASLARVSYFKVDTDITFNKVRVFGIEATANIFQLALYNADTLARIWTSGTFTTASQEWLAIGSAINITLTAGQLYFMAVSANTTGTTAGMLCFGATTTRVGVLPKNWPGSLDVDSNIVFAPNAQGQFTVTAGYLPNPAPTIAALGSMACGFPVVFLDSNNS